MKFFSRYSFFFKSIYEYREYLLQSVLRDLRKKYKRSVLGYLWSMLGPLFTMIVLTVVFSNLLPRVHNYSVFLFSGLLGWQYFQQTLNSGMPSIQSNMRIVEQVPIPKFIFVISTSCSGIVNFMLALVPLLLVMIVVGQPLQWTALLFPIVFIPLMILTLGFALLFAVATVFFDDVKHLSRILLSAWYYLTPVLYGPELMPPHVLRWLQFNPLFAPVDQLRGLFYRGTLPELLPYAYSLAFGVVILGLALWIYERCDDKFVYFA